MLATPFRWPGRSREAAALLARSVTWRAIATQLRVTERTLGLWHERPEFQAEVERLKCEIAEGIKAEGIANKQNRIDAYNDRWRRLTGVIAVRATDESMDELSGARTGTIARKYKALGSGDNMQIREEYSVDTGLLSELRELEKQAAIEMRQWTEKTEMTGADGEPLTLVQVYLPSNKRDNSNSE